MIGGGERVRCLAEFWVRLRLGGAAARAEALLGHGDGDLGGFELIGAGARIAAQAQGTLEVGEGGEVVRPVEADAAALLQRRRFEQAPAVRAGVVGAEGEFVVGLIGLAERMHDRRAEDAGADLVAAHTGEAGQANGLVGQFQPLGQIAEDLVQPRLFGEGFTTAQRTDLFEAREGGVDVDPFAEGRGVVTRDDAQDGPRVLIECAWCASVSVFERNPRGP